MKKCLFIDRDGTLVREPADEQVDSLEKIDFLPGVFASLARIRELGEYEFVMVTNQDGLGTESFPEDDFWPAQNFILKCLEGEGVSFDEILVDRSFPAEGLDTRKPGIGMMKSYMDGSYDLKNSYVIGDRLSDLQLAVNLGAKSIFISDPDSSVQEIPSDTEKSIALKTSGWGEIEEFLCIRKRVAKVVRKTKETSIEISLNLDGEGKSEIKTGLGFFDHMLEQIARHGGMDLNVRANGDLYVDEHHTVEDTAIVLGEAILQALGDKKGISRYGFVVPMDDSQAKVVLDFGGRPWFIWDAEFKRERVGDFPTELFSHFFKSFSDAAACNLHIDASGDNEHHKIEAIFKAFARAIRMGIKKIDDQLPSTKGIL
jgi:imidazoleglycerol-phosphate dehydratase/histidinol-phosphatase